MDAMSIRRLAPAPTRQRKPRTAENRTLCRARALGKRCGNAGWDMPSQRWSKRKAHPGLSARNGMHFPDELLAESSSRNPSSERDALSRWRLKRKVCPGLSARNGMHFPDELLAESSSRNPSSERDALSRWPLKRKLRPRIDDQNGTRFPPRFSTPKTSAPSIPKLGRRKPKRNGRRST